MTEESSSSRQKGIMDHPHEIGVVVRTIERRESSQLVLDPIAFVIPSMYVDWVRGST